jgi:hypothetical protein
MNRISLTILTILSLAVPATFGQLGIFSHEQDVGAAAEPGSVKLDCARGEDTVAGGGENNWNTNHALGTINVPSWLPYSRFIAFVSYQLAYPE